MIRRITKTASALAAAGLPVALVFALSGDAYGQNRCSSPYVVQPGDTLYQITQQCRVPLDELRAANPDLEDIHNIQVGARIALPDAHSRTSSGDDGANDGGRRTIRAGETLFSIARDLGVTVDALRDANPGLDPRNMEIGFSLRLPGGEVEIGLPDDERDRPGRRTISVQPLAGAPGTPVTVRGENYRPGSMVTIGWGPPQSEWERLDRAEVAADGSVRSQVAIPRYVEPGREIVFVIDNGAGVTRVSQRVDVVAERDPDAPGDGRADPITVEGRISSGVECPIITTPDGRVYSLAGARDHSNGDYVRVTGTEAEASFCMQGEATIDVRTMTEVPPPARDRDPDRAGGIPLTRDHVIASWAARGSGCREPDFAVTGNAAGGQVVETSLEGAPRTGYVRLGPNPAFIFDRPRRELPIETRGPDGLAVMPPESGPVTLGGVEIEGDGSVFVRCL